MLPEAYLCVRKYACSASIGVSATAKPVLRSLSKIDKNDLNDKN